jgi:hypothetical protein
MIMMPEVETQAPHAAHLPEGRRHLADLVVPFCALAISVAALILAVIHGRAMERMADANDRLVKANSWPFLEYSTGDIHGRSKTIEMRIRNVGVGPARVSGFEVFWRGQPIRDHEELLSRCCGARLPTPAPNYDQVDDRVLPALAAADFIYLPLGKPSEAVWRRLEKERLNVTARICYCSVFDECWIAHLSATEPTRQAAVDHCPNPANGYQY